MVPIAETPALESYQPYSIEHGYVEADIISCASHDNALYHDDNAEFYYKIKEVTGGTSYADLIKPFQRSKDVRGAWMSPASQYAGEDKWEMETNNMDFLLNMRKFNGQSNYLLERHTQKHINSYISMTDCAQHVAYQLPNEHTIVGYLIDFIENDNAGLQVALGEISNDKGPNRMGSTSNLQLHTFFQWTPLINAYRQATSVDPMRSLEIMVLRLLDLEPNQGSAIPGSIFATIRKTNITS